MNVTKKVESIARKMRMTKYAEMDGCKEREDFYGLYSDIVQELMKKDKEKVNVFTNLPR